MASLLGSLETEILALVLEFVDDESPSTTKAVSLVNHRLYATTKLIAHRRKAIVLSKQDSESNPKSFELDLIDKWLQSPAVLTGLRHLNITEAPLIRTDAEFRFPFVAPEGFNSHIARLISSLANPRTLIWGIPHAIDRELLDAIQKHPKLQLKITNYSRLQPKSYDHTNIDEIALARSPALTVLRGSVNLDGSRPAVLQEAAFRRIVANAPNLKVVSMLRFKYPGGGGDGDTVKKFYTHKKPNPSVRTLSLDGYPLNKNSLEEWGKFVDLSQLEDLKFTRGLPDISYFRLAPSFLPNLKYVSFNLAYNHKKDYLAAVLGYIENCAALESLSLWSWSHIIPLSTILAKHGPALKTLQLHERESMSITEPRRVLSAANIKSIRDACPKLKDLTFDMNREDAELTIDPDGRNAHILALLSSFGAQLEKVQIYFDLGLLQLLGYSNLELYALEENDGELFSECGDNEFYDDSAAREVSQAQSPDREPPQRVIAPSTNKKMRRFVGELWRDIFGQRITGARELDIKFGEWERKAAMVAEEARLKTLWKARPGLRDDGLDVGEVGCSITCIGGDTGGHYSLAP